MLTAKEKSLLSALEPRAASEGVEIVTLEIVGSKKAPTIRVYIDTAAGGISFDELARYPGLGRPRSWTELDPFPGAYTLEVSSPGIDRPLRTPGPLPQAPCGQTAAVKATVGPHRRPQLVDRRPSRRWRRTWCCVSVAARRRRHLPHPLRQHQEGPRLKGTVDFSA